MGGFSAAQATCAKRRAAQTGVANAADSAIAAARPMKVPRAGDVALSQPVSRAPANYRSLPLSAPVHVCMYKVTECANDVWDAVDSEVPLYQVQIEHNAQRPITFHIRGKFLYMFAQNEHLGRTAS